MGVQYDCVTWSVDKNKSHMFEWYPDSPSINRLPDNYTVSVDNSTLIHKASGIPIIEYRDGGFKALRSITDWEMYICFNRNTGVLTLETGIEIKIGAVVAGGAGAHLMQIKGNATLTYHDSIWSESSIEIEGVKINGMSDDVHKNLPFIYCQDFTATDVKIKNVNRIFAKGGIFLKNVYIRDESDEGRYVHDILDRELMPGMYIHAGMAMTAEDSDIVIHNYIEAYMMTLVRSHIAVHNLVSQKFAIYSLNRMLLNDTAIEVSRSNMTDAATTLDLLYIKNGNLVLENGSRLIAQNDAYGVMDYSCISLGEGNIVMSHSDIRTSAYPKAISMKCYGDTVVNPTGGEIRMNFNFIPLVRLAADFRFKTELNGYKMWAYVNGRTVTKVECISAADYLEDFEPGVYKVYVQSSLSRVLPGPEEQEHCALMAATMSATHQVTEFRVEAV